MHSRLFLLILLLAAPLALANAQAGLEPDVRSIEKPRTTFSDGLKNAWGFNLTINNFGFAVGTEYRRSVGDFTDLVFETHWSGLKDDTEQSFQFYSGQQVVPNKQNRIMAFPLLMGVRQRIFANAVSDNFRIYVSGQVGPSLAFVYPYYNQQGYENVPYYFFDDPTQTLIEGPVPGRDPDTFPNDALQGWGDGSWLRGMAGQFTLGADFGTNFKSLQSIKLGYYYQYYPDGIQVLEPVNVLGYNPNLGAFAVVKGAGKQRYFASPVITLVLGGMW